MRIVYMKKIHWLSRAWDSDEIQFLSGLGFHIPNKYHQLGVPDDERYDRICDSFAEKGVSLSDFISYEYTEEEILSAPYCLLSPWHSCGYPKPENSYELKTFDTVHMCPTCHVGRVQNNSYRVGKVSKHGFWGFFAWEWDVRFVSDAVYEQVFSSYNIPRRHVNRASGPLLEGISQLEIPVTDESLDLFPYQYEICPDCGSKRYLPGEWSHHPFFPLHKHPLPGIYMTKELFGQGWEVRHQILASADIVNKLLELKEIPLDRLLPCTQDIEQYWGAKSDYSIDELRGRR